LNIYNNKKILKFILLLSAITIGLISILYTTTLVNKLSKQERKKVELWAEGMKELSDVTDLNQNVGFIFKVIENNETVPVIVTDSTNKILFHRNLDSTKVDEKNYMINKLNVMKNENKPIKIKITADVYQYVYYENSILLKHLFYYPFIQIGVIFLFILVSYIAFSSSRKAEQNQVWVGLSKETAHQLGTPTSSLLAWIELLKTKKESSEIALEIEKDVKRLELITERFSKIGSQPVLNPNNIVETTNLALDYIEKRISKKIQVSRNFSQNNVIAKINAPLFEWVLENLCKNAIDAMGSEGKLSVTIIDNNQFVYIDISDTGKGISKKNFNTIFNPGFTTKKRGWGLGLSLTKRIVEEYHKGKIFVKRSEINIGTTFRIVLAKKI
jgi:sensor histidine kinase YesM